MGVLRHHTIIAAAASESGILDLTDRVLIGIHVPDAWTAANLTFLAAEKQDGDYSRVDDAAGTELEITVSADRFIVIAPDATRAIQWLKLRSGTSAAAVVQAADRDLILATVEDDRA